jgi:Zn-dependent M28 family amino/carboxypeptidase
LFNLSAIHYIRYVKTPLLLFVLSIAVIAGNGQKTDTSRVNRSQSDGRLLEPLRYLASDHLKGRHVGQPEIDTAALYIATQFKQAGARPVDGATGYYQIFGYHFTLAALYPQVAENMSDKEFTLRNVVAFVKGTDPVLSSQYIVLSAHYDHVGFLETAVEENGKKDSIYNGARDNATGVAAVIAAARYFARYPPKRSVLFICYTAEEEGEIGSQYYVAHPLIPLDRTVFNLNVDNASYNTTHAICLFGLGRTSADSLIRKACMSYGLAVLDEPAGLHLFERSDNYSMAEAGVPAPTFAMGMKQWDGEIISRYHRLSDEVGNMDLKYVARFIRAYILSAQNIADNQEQPSWARAIRFKGAGQDLYKQGLYKTSDNKEALLAPLLYLASDNLRGRHIGLPEIDTAALYIADQFKLAGAKPVPGANGYFQAFKHIFSRLSKVFTYDPQTAVNIPWAKGAFRMINVLAFVPGTDPALRDQYVILSAHYDHLGVGDSVVLVNGQRDSIFNGARDNATGVAAVIAAAKHFAKHPAKRSILFICYTGKEEGLVGSEYYAKNPLVPLDHTVFNLNVDNAGYNTTYGVCLFGLGRTSADSLIEKACGVFGLGLLPDPTAGLLFGTSDNASLAHQGIPAPTFSMGMTAWDSTIQKHYHRVSDEVGNMDLDYVAKFIQAYLLSAEYIANDPRQPLWTKDDPCEESWKALFAPAVKTSSSR